MTVIRKDMGYDRAEFFRILPLALRDYEHRMDDGDTIAVVLGAGRVTIRLGPLSSRRIALLNLPVLPVELTFEGVAPDMRDRFMIGFDNSFRRGGG